MFAHISTKNKDLKLQEALPKGSIVTLIKRLTPMVALGKFPTAAECEDIIAQAVPSVFRTICGPTQVAKMWEYLHLDVLHQYRVIFIGRLHNGLDDADIELAIGLVWGQSIPVDVSIARSQLECVKELSALTSKDELKRIEQASEFPFTAVITAFNKFQEGVILLMNGCTKFDQERDAPDVVVLMEKNLATAVEQSGNLVVGKTLCVIAWELVQVANRSQYLRAIACCHSKLTFPVTAPTNQSGIDTAVWPVLTGGIANEIYEVSCADAITEKYRSFPNIRW